MGEQRNLTEGNVRDLEAKLKAMKKSNPNLMYRFLKQDKKETEWAEIDKNKEVKMGEKEDKIIEELNQKIGEAQEAEGFFVTISHRIKDRLYHYQTQINFKPDDCILSLNEVEKLVRKSVPKTSINIVKFKPRTFK